MTTNLIDQTLAEYKQVTPDICEHLDTLTELAKECDHITEMGFRYGASSCAFLKAKPKKLISYDLSIPQECRQLFEELRGDTTVYLIQADTLGIMIEDTDMLFIDTLHTYQQLKRELQLHGNKAQKYLVFHDTVTFGHIGEDKSEKGLMDAVTEFLEQHHHWTMHKHYENNNGLSILKRGQ